MKDRTVREQLRRPWMLYLAATFTAIGLKAHYSRATVADLAWVLDPTATVVGWLRGQPLVLDAPLGWMAPDGSFVIAPACAGVNFLILVFAVAVLGFTHRLPTSRALELVPPGRRYGVPVDDRGERPAYPGRSHALRGGDPRGVVDNGTRASRRR